MVAQQEQVRVDIGNNLEGQPDEVRCAMAGLAYITGALISVGYNNVIPQADFSGLEFLTERINSGLTDESVWQRLEEAHPTIGQLVDDTERFKTSKAFEGYLHRLGCLDHLYELRAVKDQQPSNFTLTIHGYD